MTNLKSSFLQNLKTLNKNECLIVPCKSGGRIRIERIDGSEDVSMFYQNHGINEVSHTNINTLEKVLEYAR